jgi:hypothetical protein
MAYYVLYSSPKGSIVQVLSKSNQGIVAEFVLQLIEMSSNQYRSCTTKRNGPGGI